MTVATTVLGLLPLLWESGVGADVSARTAAPVVGGLMSCMLLTLLVLLHRGKGGGMSSMFGGGVTSSLAGSSVAEKNLDRITVGAGLIWGACIIALGLLLKANS